MVRPLLPFGRFAFSLAANYLGRMILTQMEVPPRLPSLQLGQDSGGGNRGHQRAVGGAIHHWRYLYRTWGQNLGQNPGRTSALRRSGRS